VIHYWGDSLQTATLRREASEFAAAASSQNEVDRAVLSDMW